MDLLEHASFGADIIVLQTVLEEVRHRSLPLYNRLQSLLQEEERRIWLFYNEARS
jgi:exosome complex exonuclease DIS3/RRP44